MIVDYHRLNQIGNPVEAPIHDVISLLQQINKFPDVQYVASDLVNASCSILLKKQDHSMYS